MLGIAIVGKGINGYAATGGKQAYHLDITRIHQLHQVFHNHVHAVFVKVAVVTETEQIQFKTLALDHTLARYIVYDYAREIGLAGNRTQRGEFRTVERNQIFIAGMLVDESFQHLGCIVGRIFHTLVAQQCAVFYFFVRTFLRDI